MCRVGPLTKRHANISQMSLQRGINLRALAEKMGQCSGAEVRGICTEAGMYALRERRQHVTQEDFEFAVAKVRATVVHTLLSILMSVNRFSRRTRKATPPSTSFSPSVLFFFVFIDTCIYHLAHALILSETRGSLAGPKRSPRQFPLMMFNIRESLGMPGCALTAPMLPARSIFQDGTGARPCTSLLEVSDRLRGPRLADSHPSSVCAYLIYRSF